MELMLRYRDLLDRINLREILLISGVSCCLGLVFNHFGII